MISARDLLFGSSRSPPTAASSSSKAPCSRALFVSLQCAKALRKYNEQSNSKINFMQSVGTLLSRTSLPLPGFFLPLGGGAHFPPEENERLAPARLKNNAAVRTYPARYRISFQARPPLPLAFHPTLASSFPPESAGKVHFSIFPLGPNCRRERPRVYSREGALSSS